MSDPKAPHTPRLPSPDARTVVPGREVTYHNAPPLTWSVRGLIEQHGQPHSQRRRR
jgi:hypothetical protein